MSNRGHVTGINITVQLPGINSTQEVPEVVEFVRQLARQTNQAHPEVEVRLAGMVMMNNAFTEASKLDMATLVPLSFALMLLTLAVLLRNLWGTLATLVVIAFSVVTALGLGGHLGVPISPPSASAPTIILTRWRWRARSMCWLPGFEKCVEGLSAIAQLPRHCG